MFLTTKNLFAELDRAHNEMNQLFGLFNSGQEKELALDIWSSDDELIVSAEIPGVEPEDIETTVVANQLQISATVKQAEADGVFHRKERRAGTFSRKLRLPYDVENNEVSAEYTNGILTVTLPRAEASKPKRIEIKAS